MSESLYTVEYRPGQEMPARLLSQADPKHSSPGHSFTPSEQRPNTVTTASSWPKDPETGRLTPPNQCSMNLPSLLSVLPRKPTNSFTRKPWSLMAQSLSFKNDVEPGTVCTVVIPTLRDKGQKMRSSRKPLL